MSDWTEEIEAYQEREYGDLVEGFIEKYDKLWYEFVSEKFFNGGMMDNYNV